MADTICLRKTLYETENKTNWSQEKMTTSKLTQKTSCEKGLIEKETDKRQTNKTWYASEKIDKHRWLHIGQF